MLVNTVRDWLKPKVVGEERNLVGLTDVVNGSGRVLLSAVGETFCRDPYVFRKKKKI